MVRYSLRSRCPPKEPHAEQYRSSRAAKAAYKPSATQTTAGPSEEQSHSPVLPTIDEESSESDEEDQDIAVHSEGEEQDYQNLVSSVVRHQVPFSLVSYPSLV